MPGIGHFPMTEDYPTMKPFLMPVLEEIAARGAAANTSFEINA